MVARRRFQGWLAPAAPALLALTACSGPSFDDRTIEIDCTVADDYELDVYHAFEGQMGTDTWYTFGDDTPGAETAVAMTQLDPPRCDSSWAAVLTARGHDDWGAGFGEWQMGAAPRDASEYDGVAFWARTTDRSRGFTMTLQDGNTHAMGLDAEGMMECVEADAAAVAGGGYTYNEGGMVVPIGGELVGPDDCGNGFIAVIVANPEWTFHRIPFRSFRQEAMPNLNPGGMDTSRIHQFGINIPKDSDFELWIDDLGVYRNPSAPEAVAAEPASE